jgi:hypothetical protein
VLRKILQVSVVVGDEHDGVDYDAQDDEVLKQGMVGYLDESLPQRRLMVQQIDTLGIIDYQLG